MKKINQTQFKKIDLSQILPILSICLLLLGSNSIFAQCPGVLNCNDQVQVSLDANGDGLVTADMVIDGLDEACLNTLTVSIESSFGNSIPNPLQCADLGLDLIVSVEDPATGNSCWGTILLEDKLAPELICQPLTVDCDDPLPPVYNNNGPTDQFATTGVQAIDNCDIDPTISLVGEVALGDICTGASTLVRTYSAYDNLGNESATCDVVITINRVEPIFPADVEFECTAYQANNNIIYPPTSGHPFGTGNFEACNYAVAFVDELLGTCGYEASLDEPVFKIVRTWTVLDWCDNSVITVDGNGDDNSQTIKVVDTTGPQITMGPITLSANEAGDHPHPCTSTELIPAPELSDACTGVVDLQIFTLNGEADYVNGDPFNGGYIPEPGLPVGVHTITYIATDGCGNTSELAVSLTVIDDIAPVAVCDEITDVNVSSDGVAEVFAETFNDGSHDNCCMDGFQVRRMDASSCDDTLFGESVHFCCDDIVESPIIVVFRATDCYGNYNDCMVQVTVSDKQDPVVVDCPTNLTIDCDFYWEELEAAISLGDLSVLDQFGSPTFLDNCEVSELYFPSISIDQCGIGTITRSWQAVDPSLNISGTCSQLISVVHVSDFVVEFPADITSICGNDEPEFGEPELFFESCELVAVSYEDQQFDVVVDACYKIARTWTVINWCVIGEDIEEEHLEDPENALGLPFPQCDLDGDGDCDDRTFRDSWSNGVYPSAADAGTQFGPDTDPDLDPWDGYITYEQIIKVIDNESPVFVDCTIPDVCIFDGCTIDVTLPEPEATDCSSDITYTVESTTLPNGSGFGAYLTVEPGLYDVTYKATDNCGNFTACETTVSVIDCKNPTPYCVQGLVIEIMNTVPPMVDVWASDFDAGSFDNCDGPLSLSFSEDVTETSVIFDCNHVGAQLLQLWVTDAAGNQDFCTLIIEIQDNMAECGVPLVSIAGEIHTEQNESIEGVNVQLNGTSSANVLTDIDGQFEIHDLQPGGDYTLTPEKDVDPLNGVTTFDLVLISKHILGTIQLDSPYKIIAADANNSGSVTTFDLVSIRRLILNIESEFTNNTSWRFIDEDYVFPDLTNPFVETFPEVISYNNMQVVDLDASFVAVKVGDVNLSAQTNGLLGADDRNERPDYLIQVSEGEITKGAQQEINFFAGKQAVSGFQFTIDFDPSVIQFEEIAQGVLTEENFGLTKLEEGSILVSWNVSEPTKFEQETTLFSLTVEALKDVYVLEAFNISSRVIPSEAYGEENELMNVALSFGNEIEEDQFVLYQNTPNPFNDLTTIQFHLPESDYVQINFMDTAGKVLKSMNQNFSAGLNSISITKRDFQTTGVIYYQVKTSKETKTKRMVLTD